MTPEGAHLLLQARAKMLHQELIAAFRTWYPDFQNRQEGLSKAAAERVLNMVFDKIMDAICKGDSVTLTGFGSFSARTRKAAQRINPQTLTKMMVPSKVVPKFKAGKEFKVKVAKLKI